MLQEPRTEADYDEPKLRMYNPDFIRAVRAKRKQERQQENAKNSAERIAKNQERLKKEAEISRKARFALAQELRERAALELQQAEMELMELIRIEDEKAGKHTARSVKAIIMEKCLEHRIPMEEICGISRRDWCVKARHDAILTVCKERPDLSLTQIGRFFGGRDHTTIRHVCVKHGFDRGRKPGCH